MVSGELPRDVRALLVCPRCRGELVDAPDALVCPRCEVAWPVEDGVPFLVDECARTVDPPA